MNLEQLSVQELNANEKVNFDGGRWPFWFMGPFGYEIATGDWGGNGSQMV